MPLLFLIAAPAGKGVPGSASAAGNLQHLCSQVKMVISKEPASSDLTLKFSVIAITLVSLYIYLTNTLLGAYENNSIGWSYRKSGQASVSGTEAAGILC
jgi:hypothetical protein